MANAGTLSNSCAEWVDILPQSFFSVKPGESYELDVRMNVPENLSNDMPVHTCMVYITQINPVDGVNEQGANIKIAVRSGIKLYHRSDVARDSNIEITNFAYNKEEPNKLKFCFRQCRQCVDRWCYHMRAVESEHGREDKTRRCGVLLHAG